MDERLIMDIGVHQGEDTEFYLKKGFRVVGVEAHPELIASAKERLDCYVDGGRLVLVNAAISAHAGPVTFFASESRSVWGTTSQEWAERNQRLGSRSTKMTVAGVRAETLLEEYGIPYYMKVDIEGADMLCLEALQRFRDRPAFVSFESTKTSWSRLLSEFALLRELGYTRFKVVQQEDVVRQACPFPAREGAYAAHRFELGASGMFGEEAPGDWMTEHEALSVYGKIFNRYRLFGDDGLFKRSRMGRGVMRLLRPKVGWYDTHAGQ